MSLRKLAAIPQRAQYEDGEDYHDHVQAEMLQSAIEMIRRGSPDQKILRNLSEAWFLSRRSANELLQRARVYFNEPALQKFAGKREAQVKPEWQVEERGAIPEPLPIGVPEKVLTRKPPGLDVPEDLPESSEAVQALVSQAMDFINEITALKEQAKVAADKARAEIMETEPALMEKAKTTVDQLRDAMREQGEASDYVFAQTSGFIAALRRIVPQRTTEVGAKQQLAFVMDAAKRLLGTQARGKLRRSLTNYLKKMNKTVIDFSRAKEEMKLFKKTEPKRRRKSHVTAQGIIDRILGGFRDAYQWLLGLVNDLRSTGDEIGELTEQLNQIGVTAIKEGMDVSVDVAQVNEYLVPPIEAAGQLGGVVAMKQLAGCYVDFGPRHGRRFVKVADLKVAHEA